VTGRAGFQQRQGVLQAAMPQGVEMGLTQLPARFADRTAALQRRQQDRHPLLGVRGSFQLLEVTEAEAEP
jgi:hypothetical protein